MNRDNLKSLLKDLTANVKIVKALENNPYLVKRYEEAKEQYHKSQEQFFKLIDFLTREEQALLIERYINGKTTKEIAIDFYLTDGGIRNRISSIIDKIVANNYNQ